MKGKDGRSSTERGTGEDGRIRSGGRTEGGWRAGGRGGIGAGIRAWEDRG